MENGNGKTALRAFIEWGDRMLSDNPNKVLGFAEAIDKAEEFLSMERDQIVKAYDQDLYGGLTGYRKYHDGGQYYAETFGIVRSKVVTFSCGGEVHVYEEGCGVLPRWPYRVHESVEQAREYLHGKTGKEVKVKTYRSAKRLNQEK